MRTHAWFGALTPADDGSFDFEKVVKLGANDVLVSLHFDGIAGVSDETLDAVAMLCGQFESLVGAARARIETDFEKSDSAAFMYFDFLKNEAPDLLEGVQRKTFTNALQPEKFWSWFEGSISPTSFSLQLDFNIAPGENDHVLCARIDAHGKVQSVEIES